MQRSVGENIALPFIARLARWGLIDMPKERETINGAVATLQIDARAGGEVRRLSGGNQQKVTIARWVAGGRPDDAVLRSDARHRHPDQAPDLRSAALPGARKALRSCSTPRSSRRSSSPATARSSSSADASSAEIDARDADEATLLRAAHNLAPEPKGDRDGVARGPPPVSPARCTRERMRRSRRGPTGRPWPASCWAGRRRNAWALGLIGFLIVLLLFTKMIQPRYGVAGIQGLAISVLPLALAAVAQAVVVIGGGIDLSIGSIMALTSVDLGDPDEGPERGVRDRRRPHRARAGDRHRRDQRDPHRGHASPRHRRHARDVVRLGGLRAARAQHARRRRIAVAQGPRHRVRRQRVDPQGGARPHRGRGGDLDPDPQTPRLGLSIYAIGSNKLAAFRSGVSVSRTKVLVLRADGRVRRARRPEPDREHRDRDAGAGAVHAAQRRRGRARRRQPRRRDAAASSARSSRSSSCR